MSDNLQIFVTATLNEGLSVGEINKKIKSIENSNQLKAIKLKIDVDHSILNTLKDFNKSISEINKSMGQQNSINNNAINSINNVSTATQKETQAIKAQTEALAKNNAMKQKITTGEDGRVRTDTTTGTKYNNTTKSQTLNPDKTIANHPTIQNENFEAQRKDDQKFIDQMADYNIKSQERVRNFERQWNTDQQGFIQSNADLQRQEDTKNLQLAKSNADYEWNLKLKNYQELQALKQRELQQEQKNSYDLDKQHALASLQNERRDQDFYRKQQAMLDKVESSRLKYGQHKGVNDALDSATVDIKAVKNIGDYDNKLKNINTSISKTTSGLKAMRNESLSFGDAMGTAMKKFPVWMIATTAFYMPLRGMQDMVKTVIEVDSQMTQLKRVMDEDTNFEGMLRGSIEAANELGRSIKEVNENMIGFARMGFDENQTLNLAKTATLFQNISELTPDQAVDTMTAAMTVFKIKAEESIQIADKINEVDNNFAVTSQDLAMSLNKAGSSANTFGGVITQAA